MADKNPRFPLKEAGKTAEFNRWLVELIVKVIVIASGVGVVLYVVSTPFERRQELLKTNFNTLQNKFDTSLAAQRAVLDTSLNAQAAILTAALTEQHKLLEESLVRQVSNQQKLDRVRLINLLKQIRGECRSNFQRITDEAGGRIPGMKLQLELKDEAVLTSFSPDVRFKTIMGEIANTKEYFIAHRSLSTYDLAEVYEEFSQFNRFADEFNGQVLLMRSMASREGYASLEFRNTLRFATNLKEAANEIVDSLTAVRIEFDDRIERDLRELEGKKRSRAR